MKLLSELTQEFKKKSLHVFDMDETLFHHPDPKSAPKIHVNNSDGKRVKSLTNVQFNNHRLEPGHSYDFTDFKSSNIFKKSAKPIKKMIGKLKEIQRKKADTVIVTARPDLDNKEEFGKHLKKHGIDINKVHVHRAGNLDKGTTADRKKSIISSLIKKNGYNEVHLYDDAPDNLNAFLSLKMHHPDVKLTAHHIKHNEDTGDVIVNKKTAPKFNHEAEYGGATFYSPDEINQIKDGK